jgi:hypothetical protein
MVYSRWTDTDWYIFWSSQSGDTRESQKLAVDRFRDKTQTLTLAEVEDMLSMATLDRWPDLAPHTIVWLKDRMRQWVADVQHKYPEK